MKAEFVIPTSLPSVANLREHWRARAKRTKQLRSAASLLCRMSTSLALVARVHAAGAAVTLVRVADGRSYDTDNLATAFKPLRDGIADALGLDDGSPLLVWTCEQRKGEPDEVHVTIEAR